MFDIVGKPVVPIMCIHGGDSDCRGVFVDLVSSCPY